MIAWALFRAFFYLPHSKRIGFPYLNILEHVPIIFITQYQRIKLDASTFTQTSTFLQRLIFHHRYTKRHRWAQVR